MEPLPKDRPLRWDAGRIAFELSASRVGFEQRLGPPHVLEEGGAVARWGFRCDCGLELVVRHRRGTDLFSVAAEDLEVEHALGHLGLEAGPVLWRADAKGHVLPEGWAVVRQDDTGNSYDVCVMRVRAHAECLARMMEARAHKQWFAVEPRGAPPSSRQGG